MLIVCFSCYLQLASFIQRIANGSKWYGVVPFTSWYLRYDINLQHLLVYLVCKINFDLVEVDREFIIIIIDSDQNKYLHVILDSVHHPIVRMQGPNYRQNVFVIRSSDSLMNRVCVRPSNVPTLAQGYFNNGAE